jgi:hypothetical protein
VGGDANTLYHCTAAGQPPSSSQACPAGCSIQPQGTNDRCTVTLTCPSAGDYCGSDGVNGDASTLYHCAAAGEPPSSSQPCANGCSVQPAGTDDYCVPDLKCPTAGDYCGNDGVGGPANVLYHCAAAGQPPTSSTTCAMGCAIEPQGVSDVCAGANGCSAQGAAALAWEAGQLNSGNSWSDLCLGFVNNAYANATGGNSPWYFGAAGAAASLGQARGTGRFVNWNGSCPCGAALYWDANACNANWGHIVICNGDGTVSTSGWPGYGGSTSASISWLDQEECGHAPAGYILP